MELRIEGAVAEPADDEGAGLTVPTASAPAARVAAEEGSGTRVGAALETLAGDASLTRRLGPIVGLAIAVLWLVRRRWR